jgi:hypothetical protein
MLQFADFLSYFSYKIKKDLYLKPQKIMTKQEIEIEISVLRETIEDCVLTIAERVALREEISQLEAELAS